MIGNNHLDRLSSMIADLDEENALKLTRRLIAENNDPLKIIEHSHKGMVQVGLMYENGKYFISGLIMAGEIMEQISQMVLPLIIGNQLKHILGRVVLGTVEGDIHFIGKDIFKTFLRGHGFAVHDLGVDVPKNKFLSAIEEFKPDIVGFSCLISTGIDTLEETITYLRANVSPEAAPKAYLIGGRRMDIRISKAVGSDLYTADSMEGVRLCQNTLKSFKPDPTR